MAMFDKETTDKALESLKSKNYGGTTYKQYSHKGFCKSGPCINIFNKEDKTCCSPFIGKIHASYGLHDLPKHVNCDCIYIDVQIKPVGSISERQPGPDVWLTLFGDLPDYYITKKKAAEIYGWDNSKNTLAGKAPGKMIGGNIYKNKEHILPEQEGRIWYECDVNYTNGERNKQRLYYSNDGLMFYSPSHLFGEFPEVYWIK